MSMIDWVRGSCHCGAVAFEARIALPLEQVIRCNCSFCSRRGAAVALVEAPDFRLVDGAQSLSVYRWNTGREDHHFCAICGIYTHHTLADPPLRIGLNAACLEGVDVFEAKTVIGDGASLPLVKGAVRHD